MDTGQTVSYTICDKTMRDTASVFAGSGKNLPLPIQCIQQNGPLSCDNSSPECTKIAILRLKMNFFLGRGVLSSPPKKNSPNFPRRLDCRSYGTPTSAPSAPPLALDRWVPPRSWMSGYGPDLPPYSTRPFNFVTRTLYKLILLDFYFVVWIVTLCVPHCTSYIC